MIFLLLLAEPNGGEQIQQIANRLVHVGQGRPIARAAVLRIEVRVQLQKLLVPCDRALEIARLLLLDCILNQFLRSLGTRDGAKN